MAKIVRNTFVVSTYSTLQAERYICILNELDAFCCEFGGCAKDMAENEELWEIFHPVYLIGFEFYRHRNNLFEVVIDSRDDACIACYDKYGLSDCMYVSSWFAKPRTAKQAGNKLAKVLYRFADLIENGTITPGRPIKPEEVTELADFVKANIEKTA